MNLCLWTVFGALIWGAVAFAPWRAWSTRERLEAGGGEGVDLSHTAVLIPARNEAQTLGRCLQALAGQGEGLAVVVVDDESSDDTAAVARASELEDLTLVAGEAKPDGWSGKMWALQQALACADRRYVLLLDADIALAPGLLRALHEKKRATGAALVSLMASLPVQSFWEKLLHPAFIFFFKLLYPFSLSNSPSGWVAAAAGGCVLVDREALAEIGDFSSLRNELIDDCALARRIKSRGHATWVGLTHDANSLRRSPTLASIWRMVSRTAFTQLRYSPVWLGVCTVLMFGAFATPVLGLFGSSPAVALALATWCAMVLCYTPTLRFYGMPWTWGFAMPLVGALFLLMTWTSAVGYWRGQRSSWKQRDYTTRPSAER